MCRIISIVAVVFAAIIIQSCSGGSSAGTDSIAEPAESPPTETAKSSFDIGIEKNDDGTFLTIQKSALGQEFLMQGSMAIQKGTGRMIVNPTSKNIKSRIITFQEEGDELLMLESSEGLTPGEEVPSHILFASYPIVEKRESLIIFDFNKGMTNAIISWDWYASDGGMIIWPDFSFPVSESYLRELKTHDNAITVIQNLVMKTGAITRPTEFTFYFTKYKKNPHYVPALSQGLDYLGFFETNPIVQEGWGTLFTYITRWDVSKPVTYYISNAVPEKYREAVKQGVLYWNKALGREIFRAEMAPDGTTAPDFEHNMIQWHTGDANGSAYADAQIDPRTGEILHTQIFISSATANWYRSYGLQMLNRELENNDSENTDNTAEETREKDDDQSTAEMDLTAREIDGARLCDLKLAELFSDMHMHRSEIEDLPPERIEASTNDLFRWLVAHEVGHTMGLRHNFAASSVGELSAEEFQTITKNYLRNGDLEDGLKSPFNSVMDYPTTEDMLIGGALMAKEDSKPFAYDEYAMEWGYFENEEPPAYGGQPFCTDSSIGLFEDCFQNDEGKHLVERRSFDSMMSFKKVPWLLSEVYLNAKTSLNPLWRYPVKRSRISARRLAYYVSGPFSNLTRLLTSDINLLSIIVKYPALTDVDMGKVESETLDWLNSEIARAGGIEKILQLINPGTYAATFGGFQGEFEKIADSDLFKKAQLPEGGDASFTPGEIDYMKKRAADLLPLFDRKFARMITEILGSGVFKPIDEVEKAEGMIAKWAEFVIMSGKETQLCKDASNAKGCIILFSPDFRYSTGTRKEAAELLASSEGPFPDWLDSHVAPVAEKLKAKLEVKYGKPLDQIDVQSYPRDERQSIMDELEIYLILAPSIVTTPTENAQE